MPFNTTESGYELNGTPDRPDARDLPYEPTLDPLASKIDPPVDLHVLDQGKEGACTGFGLAANINFLRWRGGSKEWVSARMLYEMAKRFDEWEGQDYEGSSCRGAIKGWFNMGVCTEASWPHRNKAGSLTVRRAKEARRCPSGAYYRVAADIAHVHAALNEVGVLFCSARTHRGWDRLARYDKSGVFDRMIRWRPTYRDDGGHAFAVVGYNEDGLWIVNSWGPDWGVNGVALWTYPDWQQNVSDMWVVQLGLPTPGIDRAAKRRTFDEDEEDAAEKATRPRREQIAGHFVHIDDGKFHSKGRYWSDLEDVKITTRNLAPSEKYDHVLFYAHGGLNSPKASANRIAAMRDVFKDNRIYPYHLMYDTGLTEELKDIIFNKRSKVSERVGGFADWSDWMFEKLLRRPGRAVWREMKTDAARAFDSAEAGTQTLRAFVDAFRAPDARQKKIHLVGHSTGAILLAHLLRALRKIRRDIRVESVSLLAPAASVALFKSHYMPLVSGSKATVKKLVVYNLNDELEKDDHVARVYRKSLLYLVSNSFEEEKKLPILGMQAFEDDLPALPRRVEVIYGNGHSSRTRSTSHGGFDNDPYTLNDILKTILKGNPRRRFKKKDLEY